MNRNEIVDPVSNEIYSIFSNTDVTYKYDILSVFFPEN